MGIVEFKNVNKDIGKKQIINDISLSIEPGEVFGLLGPNGAGKTTLIKLMLGLLNMNSGEIRICDMDSKKEAQAIFKRIGALVETPVYYPYLSGLENLKIFATYSKVDLSIVEDIIETIGLKNQIHKKVSAYSLGMKQRLGLGVALLKDPDILVLDEPTNGLDPEGIAKLRTYLRKIAQEKGVTVIVSSHMLSEMNLLCDRFAIINSGKLIRIIDKNDYLISESMQRYVIQVSDLQQSYEILNKNHKIEVNEDVLICTGTRDDIADVVIELVEGDIRVYAIQPEGNPLEKLYFESIGKKEEIKQ